MEKEGKRTEKLERYLKVEKGETKTEMKLFKMEKGFYLGRVLYRLTGAVDELSSGITRVDISFYVLNL